MTIHSSRFDGFCGAKPISAKVLYAFLESSDAVAYVVPEVLLGVTEDAGACAGAE
jgi:hypothetical protein